ncbi:FCD domain-containing protein [Amycolatopsis sp. NPDC005232]|uniref:FCD domain-containing protein n=1 Tax=Amycolatopsis sp. NPDC005232 TaxID=3157027 RepID=UPI0033B69857
MTEDATVRLTDAERSTLLGWASQDAGPLGLRSRIVLSCADGLDVPEVARRLGVSEATAAKWRDRFLRRGPDGLADAPRPGRPRSPDRAEAERLVLSAIAEARRGGEVPTTRSLARTVGLSQSTVSRIWREHRTPEPAPTRLSTPDRGGQGLLSDQVHQVLRQQIIDGELRPGLRLVESAIARQLGTSQAPAREAIKRLVHEGLVSSLPHRGNYVAEISAEQAREVRAVRVVLEEFAAREATVRVQPRTLRLLEESVDRMRTAATAGDIGAFREADITFHRDVCAASGNSFLARLWRTMEPNLWGLHVVSNPLYDGDWSAMAERHADLVTALAAGDPDEAARLFAAHARGRASLS